MLLSYDVLFFDVYLHVYVFIVTHIVFNFRSPPYLLDPADPYHNMIGDSTVAFGGGSNEGAVLQAAGINMDLCRLQSDATRAFGSFK